MFRSLKYSIFLFCRPVSLVVRIYCWHMVIVGVAGGVIAFISAVTNIKDALSEGTSCWTTMFQKEFLILPFCSYFMIKDPLIIHYLKVCTHILLKQLLLLHIRLNYSGKPFSAQVAVMPALKHPRNNLETCKENQLTT